MEILCGRDLFIQPQIYLQLPAELPPVELSAWHQNSGTGVTICTGGQFPSFLQKGQQWQMAVQ